MNSDFVYDLCVVGSGPAGIILTLEYSRLNPDKTILLVEYGTRKMHGRNSLDDSIRIKDDRNHHDPYECTNKGFGGTSATWGGRCVMYDEIDFLPRDIIGKECTWGMELFNDVKKYLSLSSEYFECGSSVFNLHDLDNIEVGPIAEGFVEGDVTDSTIERWSMPTRFRERYLADVKAAGNIKLMEGFEFRDCNPPDLAGLVGTARLRKVETNEAIEIKSKKFVLAAGTQETTRILLRNSHLFKNLGKTPPALGHYYQGHVSGKIASVKFKGRSSETDYGFLRDADRTYVRRRFQFTCQLLKAENLLNTAIWLDNPLYYDPAHKSGAMSFMYLAMITPYLGKKLAPPAIAHSITKGKVTDVRNHFWNILKGIPGSILTPLSIFYRRYMLTRKLPGVFLFSPENIYALHFHAEQIPAYGNQMYLDKDNETLIIDYSLSPPDIKSVIRAHEVLDEWLQKCGCGKLEYWFPKEDLFDAINRMSKDGIHQSGTTRIAGSSEDGVVNNDLKLWGTSNVYICSSSVFPTSSQANPTFLLGAFAARLANHISQKSA